jgi:hypothetical protein
MRASSMTSFAFAAGLSSLAAMLGALTPASAAAGTWHRGGWHGGGAGWGVGVGVGALAAGAAIASSPYYYGYGPSYYGYGPAYYPYGPGYYSYGPAYYAYGPGYYAHPSSGAGAGCTRGASMYYGC